MHWDCLKFRNLSALYRSYNLGVGNLAINETESLLHAHRTEDPLSCCTKIISKWIKELSVTTKIQEVMRKTPGKALKM